MDMIPDGGAPTATITDVAEACGVSIRTVSRVLNASPKVGEETRKTIEAAIERLAFKPNSRARGLAAGRSYLIGVVQDDPNAHVIGVLQRGIAEVCAADGFELVVHPARYDDLGIVDHVVGFARRSRVDGLLLLPPLSELESVAQALAAMRLPVVALAAVRIPHHAEMLVSDERHATALAATHLIALGHRRLGVITGPAHFHSAQERRIGFCDAAEAAGVPVPAAYIREGDYGFASGLEAARALLALPEAPTAIFAGNDIMAAAVLKVAAERGLAVPAQLSVIGFDDSDIASMVTPALTTVRRPLEAMAADATRRLLAMIADRGLRERHDATIELALVERQSTDVPAASGNTVLQQTK